MGGVVGTYIHPEFIFGKYGCDGGVVCYFESAVFATAIAIAPMVEHIAAMHRLGHQRNDTVVEIRICRWCHAAPQTIVCACGNGVTLARKFGSVGNVRLYTHFAHGIGAAIAAIVPTYKVITMFWYSFDCRQIQIVVLLACWRCRTPVGLCTDGFDCVPIGFEHGNERGILRFHIPCECGIGAYTHAMLILPMRELIARLAFCFKSLIRAKFVQVAAWLYIAHLIVVGCDGYHVVFRAEERRERGVFCQHCVFYRILFGVAALPAVVELVAWLWHSAQHYPTLVFVFAAAIAFGH